MTIRRAALPSVLFVSLAVPAVAAPNPPLITEPSRDGQIVNPADVHMEATYSDPDGSAHASTDWELWDTSAAPAERIWSRSVSAPPNLMVHIHLGDGTFEGSYAGRTQLKFDTAYELRVRFWNAGGEPSPLSARPFRTSPQGPPGVPGPMPWVVLQPGYTVEVVATGFQLPVNIAFVPNPGTDPSGPFLYVTELYGNIKVLLRNGTLANYATSLLNFDPTGIFPGSGEQGLAGIVVDPATGDVLASLLYEDSASPENPKPHYAKVLRLHSTDGGRTADPAQTTTVLDMFGERFYESHQISNLTIGPDGKLYVHVGDGFDSGAAQDLDSFRGKILRLNLDGSAPADNPFYDDADGITARDYVFAYGFRNPFGGAWRASDGAHYEVENGPDVDRFAKVVAGRNYGWDGTNESMFNFALYNWGLPCPPCGPAHSPVNVAFVQPGTFSGSGFPFAKMDHAYVTESGPTYAAGPQELGKRIVEFALDPAGSSATGPTKLVEYNGTGRATAVGLSAGPDGLYFTDLYKDQDSDPPNPIEPGANLLRIRYNAATAEADLAITKLDGPMSADPGAPATYTIEATNLGPGAVSGATVTDNVPAGLTGASWTCVGANGGTCAASGSGSIDDTVDLPAGASVTYTLSGTIGPTGTGLGNMATVTAPPGMTDPNLANNTALLRRPGRRPALPPVAGSVGGPPAGGSAPRRGIDRSPPPARRPPAESPPGREGRRRLSGALCSGNVRTCAGGLPAQEERGPMISKRRSPGFFSVTGPLAVVLGVGVAPLRAQPPAGRGEPEPSTTEIMDTFTKASTGNVADAVDEATGVRGFMSRDMKPVFKAKVIGPAVTVFLQRALRTDKRDWPNLQIQTLDEAPPGSVIVEVLEDGLDTAGVGNLMATTAKVRGLAGMVIDGGARDIEELEEIGFPIWSRTQTPATSVGRYVPVAKNVAVTCGGVLVRPGDWIVGDLTGVVVVPKAALPQVLKLLRQYDDKETKMIPLIKETKSMGKALQIFNRY